jgi:hypothetical protein
MGLDQIGKVIFKLFRFEFVRAAVKIIPDPANRPGVRINGLLGFTLKFQGL